MIDRKANAGTLPALNSAVKVGLLGEDKGNFGKSFAEGGCEEGDVESFGKMCVILDEETGVFLGDLVLISEFSYYGLVVVGEEGLVRGKHFLESIALNSKLNSN